MKKAAALRAMDFLVPGAFVGVGTGSTVRFFIEALAARRSEFRGAVSSSEQSTRQLRECGVQVFELNDVTEIPVYVDGADEVDPRLCLIKGGGAALTREKIIAEASARFVCIVDGSKLVPVLGRFPLPIEVVPMARALVMRKLVGIGAQPRLREGVTTDNGNVVIDASGLSIDDPVSLEREINQWPGVVTNGLFARRRADLVLVAGAEGTQELRPRQ